MKTPSVGTRDTSARTAELVKLISEIGPDIPEIARRLDQFKESVRYRYKEKVLSKGFGVQAIVDHEKLGLRRVLFVADFGPEFKGYTNAILTAMNELCYVVYFEKRLLYDDYVVAASVPSEHVASYVSFLNSLKESGLFKSLKVVPFDWFRTNPMRTECYDFDTGRWDFDWSTPLKTSDQAAYAPSGHTKFDYMDLLILKELQIDATRSFVEISEKLKLNYKVLAWHMKTHVMERKMISGYYLRWMGTTYDTVLEKALHRQHRYQHISLLSTGLSERERMELMAKLHTIPFLWSEMVGASDYFAEFYFPTEDTVEGFQFLTRAIADVKVKTEVMVLDQSEALSFTISHNLYSKDKKAWGFDEPALLSRFQNLTAQIKGSGGS
ncbi:MAG: Lrp/AsnC family transcriptional regulator [Nitrososphaerota archaeon]|nr:Lrp/AsnC family transcriptional regulator [Nitrososphaerota archaeon]MDG6987638.1 Lrp/AsnC family transcriptional regulator [Nitrososphaerota archaeon]MDG7015028.1 Lrp/AsnC family transcriptional regulator [Nitrososphaerota archaeon]WGO50981.1 MAG: Lrp/AsnC family transcriptional regulator [Nitrososphaerota archaeon]